MKSIIPVGIVATLILGGIYIKSLDGGVIYATNDGATTTTETIVEPDWATDEEAVEAAKAVMRRKELEAEETRLQGQLEALESELEAVQGELADY